MGLKQKADKSTITLLFLLFRLFILCLQKRVKFSHKSIPSLLGLFITLIVPPVISISSYFWLIPQFSKYFEKLSIYLLTFFSVLLVIFAMSMKKHVSRTHLQMEQFAYTLFLGTNILLSITFLFGVATSELPIWTATFALGAIVVWHFFFTLIGSDGGVVEQTESEIEAVSRATAVASFPEDYCVTCGVRDIFENIFQYKFINIFRWSAYPAWSTVLFVESVSQGIVIILFNTYCIYFILLDLIITVYSCWDV